MNKEKILQRLCNDEDYYGEFGNKYLSNSHVGKLLKDPLRAFEPSKTSPAFLVGGYFHTCIIEPDKLEKFKVVKSTTRNTKAYKDVAGGELCLLQHEVDTIELMRDKVMANDICKDLITLGNVEYEKPMITELFGNQWKGKADIVNHDEKLIIDLKTTGEGGASPEKAIKTIANLNYHIQAAHYLETVQAKEFNFIFVEKVYPFAVGIYKLDKDALLEGRSLREQALKEISLCHTDNYWRGYSETVQTLSMPRWAFKN